MKAHKHRDVIIAWANGAEIEFKDFAGNWRDIPNPCWKMNEYRIKPEPKPDVVLYSLVYDVIYRENLKRHDSYISTVYDSPPTESNPANLKLIFDGETGKLKSAEVIK